VSSENAVVELLRKKDGEIATKWLELQSSGGKKISGAEQQEFARRSRELLAALKGASSGGSVADITGPGWDRVKEILADLSASRAKSGYTPSETASAVFALKQAFFVAIRGEFTDDAKALAATWEATELLDKLALFTTDAYQKTREDVISRQQAELLELSTPVVRLWENVLALPLIGTLDSARTQVVMQNLLDAIVETRSDFAIIDITGVPVVDTLVAQHLLKTVAAARLMGADCLISGIRPQIAQTIIHLGVDLTNVTTKATLADAFAIALKRSGQKVVPIEKRQAEAH
jgi:rsbT co-antagonist protein RsbR